MLAGSYSSRPAPASAGLDRPRRFAAEAAAITLPALAVGVLTGAVTLLAGETVFGAGGPTWAEGPRGAVGCGRQLTVTALFAGGLADFLPDRAGQVVPHGDGGPSAAGTPELLLQPQGRPSYSSAATRSRPYSSAIVAAVQWAFRPLGLGRTQIRVPPMVRCWGPIRAVRSAKAAR